MRTHKVTVIVTAGVALAAAAVCTGCSALDAAGLGFDSVPSDNQAAVEKDPTWLGYMPTPTDGVTPAVTSFQAPESNLGRSVNLSIEPGYDSVYLCFAETERELATRCETGKVLGRTDRDVAEPWVAVVGETDVDLMAHLQAPIPSLEDVPSLAE